MKISHIIILLFSVSLIAACSSNDKGTSASSANSAKVITETVQIENDTVSTVYGYYIQLKEALVKSDAGSANQAANKLSAALKNIQGCENTSLVAKDIGSSNDLKQQRAHFTTISSDIISMMKNTDLSSGTIFIQYCPMANDGEGGYWLDSHKEIRNPYYGNEMLNCGEVKEEIKPKKS